MRSRSNGSLQFVGTAFIVVLLCVAALLGAFTFVSVRELQNEVQELRKGKALDEKKNLQSSQELQQSLKQVTNELQAARQAHEQAAAQVGRLASASARDCPPVPIQTQQRISQTQHQQVVVREEKVKPLLRWMGIDGGTDFFKVFVMWDRLARITNGLIVEVGAGDGRQAAKAASQGWRVITVDANQNNLELGKKFLAEAKNITGSVQWNWYAVSNYSGEAQFYGDVGMGRLLDGKQGEVTDPSNKKWAEKTTTVQVRRLDDIVGDVEPFLLKIDVEGHELNVLRGATKLLAKKPKVIIIEWNPVMMEWAAKADAYEVLKILHDLGYDLYDTAISEPKKKGFLAKYPGFHRPTGFRELVDYFKKSKEFDWWGSWTDIIAVDPNYV